MISSIMLRKWEADIYETKNKTNLICDMGLSIVLFIVPDMRFEQQIVKGDITYESIIR